VDTIIHDMRRRCDGSRARVHRWWHCSVEVLMGGRLDGGVEAPSRGRLGENDPDKRAPSVSDGDMEQKIGWAHT
jgi:hypothetical protein